MYKDARILVIEDQSDNREFLYDMLSDYFTVSTAVNGKEGLQMARKGKPDLILLDIVMPGYDGMATCKDLKSDQGTKSIPVLFFTGMNTEELREEAFLMGADDFITKPCSRNELYARVSNRLKKRLGVQSSTDKVSFGNILLDVPKMEAKVAGNTVQISKLEFSLLKYFIENRERILTREEILNRVWNDAVVSHRTIDTHIASLRKKLADFDGSLTTVYGMGYIIK